MAVSKATRVAWLACDLARLILMMPKRAQLAVGRRRLRDRFSLAEFAWRACIATLFPRLLLVRALGAVLAVFFTVNWLVVGMGALPSEHASGARSALGGARGDAVLALWAPFHFVCDTVVEETLPGAHLQRDLGNT